MNLFHKSETCSKCGQRIRKSKQRTKVDADGVQRLPDGREIDRTKEARQRRTDQLFERDKHVSPMRGEFDPGEYWVCAGCGKPSLNRADFDPDHKIKRSLKRDDRLSNRQLLGNANLCNCHDKKDSGMRYPKEGKRKVSA